MSRLKYTLGTLAAVPCLPFLLRDGKRIKGSVPVLPEAANPAGINGSGARTINLLAFGESTMAGVGVSDHKKGVTAAVAQVLAQEYDATVTWKVVARSGYTMRAVTHKLLPKAGDFRPDIIVTGIGANDAFKTNSPTEFAAAAREFIKKIQTIYPGVPLVFMNMPPIKEFPAFTRLIRFFIGNLVELHGAALAKTVAKYENVYYIAEKITFKDWIHKADKELTADDFFSDGVHPSGMTYGIWGRETGNYIVENNLL